MNNKEKLLQLWQELVKYWNDEAMRTFEQQHLNALVECLEEIEREHEKFKDCVTRNKR